jgi:hypothetical protein
MLAPERSGAQLTACPWGPVVNGVQQTICVDTTSNQDHCGGCWQACEPISLTHKVQCVASRCVPKCPSSAPTYCAAPAGASPYGSECVDTMNSDNHCGGCWQRCATFHKCVAGKCVPSCPDKSTPCQMSNSPATLQCVDTNVNDQHCGACFNVCPSSTDCVNGKCVCSTGRTLCTFPPYNYVECVDTVTNSMACGGCPNSGGKVCPSNMVCKGGQCVCPSTKPTACVTTAGQTMCFNTLISKDACGSCFNQCSWKQRCVNGVCMESRAAAAAAAAAAAVAAAANSE